MRRILYYSSATHRQGGAVKMMYRLASYFHNQPDTRVLVVLPDREGIAADYLENNIPVAIIPFMRLGANRSWGYRLRYLFSLPPTILQLIRLIRREQIDLVHINEIIYFPGLIAARFARVGAVCHVRVILAARFPLLSRIFARWASFAAEKLIVVSQATGTALYPRGAPRKLIVSYDVGPDYTRFDPCRFDRENLRRRYQFTGDYVVGMVSKLSPVKGHRLLVAVAAVLKEQEPHVPWKFVMVGGDVPSAPDFRRELLAEARRRGVDNALQLLGQRSDIPELLYAFDCFVHIPEHDDPFPGVVLEAMAMERPVVASDSGGIPEQLKNGETGLLVAKSNVNETAAAILRLATDPAAAAQMGRAARRDIMARFTANRHFREIESVYREVAGK